MESFPKALVFIVLQFNPVRVSVGQYCIHLLSDFRLVLWVLGEVIQQPGQRGGRSVMAGKQEGVDFVHHLSVGQSPAIGIPGHDDGVQKIAGLGNRVARLEL